MSNATCECQRDIIGSRKRYLRCNEIFLTFIASWSPNLRRPCSPFFFSIGMDFLIYILSLKSIPSRSRLSFVETAHTLRFKHTDF